VPLFVFSSGYVLGAVRELGLFADDAVRPRPVVSGAFILLIVAFVLLTVDLIRTLGFMRVERVLGTVTSATIAAANPASDRLAGLRLASSAALTMPADAAPLRAPRSGYIVDIDVPRLVREAERLGVRACIIRGVGEYVDAGEVVGWAS